MRQCGDGVKALPFPSDGAVTHKMWWMGQLRAVVGGCVVQGVYKYLIESRKVELKQLEKELEDGRKAVVYEIQPASAVEGTIRLVDAPPASLMPVSLLQDQLLK
ncbi:hypothetical protein EAH_00033580 [Eimeria acervulina]|uniref:Uncharacterized protein n=1 Tax=Eimeria acervulina TaxID=5801 RepID=U6GUC5_EIMAC|nr:hypothetical protein EAH_00033580 [Eimeria acervulina]CDI83147.1 hypothetical protein EAH_00033580 [Eimeria acervulina]